MQKNRLINQLSKDHPKLVFKNGDDFMWSPQHKTIYYPEKNDDNFELLILHEVAHASLGHASYKLDIELLAMDSDAWGLTNKILAPKYKVEINPEVEDEKLESYRDWIHKRSLCPKCNINGYQKNDLNYYCPLCGTTWKPNNAKFNQLKRRIV